MLKLASGIASRGYRVDLVLARAHGEYLSEIPANIRLIDLKSSRDFFSLIPLANYLKKESPDVLLSGLHTNIIAVAAKKVAGNRHTRVFVSERNTFSARTKIFSADLRMRLMPLLVKSLYPLADGVVAVSQGVANDLTEHLQIPRENIAVIYNPVITDELKKKARETVNHPWFSPGQPPVILSVGRLSPQKNFSLLISALAQVVETHPARLLILGEGDQRTSLENQIGALGLKQIAQLPGFLPNPYPYMKHAAVFVLSSNFEGLPGVLIEALFCNGRVVATDCPSGPREILADGAWGQLVPTGNAPALAQAIKQALTQNFPQPGEESWMRFELDTVVNQYLELFFS